MIAGLTFLLVVSAWTAVPGASTIARGNDLFRLGMSRAEVDSAVAGRGVEVISNGTAFLVCGSDDPAVEYEQYSFFQTPHGPSLLWKVTVGYRLDTRREDLDRVLGQLVGRLGPPSQDSAALAEGTAPPPADAPPPAARQVTWVDPATAVQLGARWSDSPDRNADRMLVTWTDRRIQRLFDARHKKEKPPAPEKARRHAELVRAR